MDYRQYGRWWPRAQALRPIGVGHDYQMSARLLHNRVHVGNLDA